MKKTWNIIKKVIVWMIVVFSVGMMAFTIVSVTTFDRADRSVFGYSAFIVLSDSMKATDFDAGDLVLIKETDPSTLKEGDIISFQSPDEANYGEIVTHKIREVTTDEDGNPGFVTYGTTTNANDQGIVTYNLVIGKYQGHIPNVGTFFQFLKTVPGYFICIFTPFFILILVQARNSIKLFRQYKKEQLEEIQKEKKELEDERLKSQEMMEQLMRMQQQMGQNGGQIPPEYLAQMAQVQQTQHEAAPQQPQPQPQAQAPVQPQTTAQPAYPDVKAQIAAQQPAPARPQTAAPAQPSVQPQQARLVQPQPQVTQPQTQAQPTPQPADPEQQVHTQAQSVPPVQPQTTAQPVYPDVKAQVAAQQAAPARPQTAAPAQPAAHQQVQQQTPVQPQQNMQPARHTSSRNSFDIRSIVGETSDSQDKNDR